MQFNLVDLFCIVRIQPIYQDAAEVCKGYEKDDDISLQVRSFNGFRKENYLLKNEVFYKIQLYEVTTLLKWKQHKNKLIVHILPWLFDSWQIKTSLGV